MKIWANTLVKNEENYVWYSIMSVINHVDKVLVYDTGSTDKTVEIINEIRKAYPEKIIFKEVGGVNINSFTEVRQEMLTKTQADWLLILDGDEVWWKEGIVSLVNIINKNKNLESVVNRHYSIAGDIYHYQDEVFGKYQIDDQTGHINIRAMSMNIPGVNFQKPHGQLGIYDGEGKLIQNRSKNFRHHIISPAYLHFTNVRRSGMADNLVPKRSFKYKHTLGMPFANDFYYPEAFFIERPDIVPTPWVKRSLRYELQAAIEKPLKDMKRNLKIFQKSGY